MNCCRKVKIALITSWSERFNPWKNCTNSSSMEIKHSNVRVQRVNTTILLPRNMNLPCLYLINSWWLLILIKTDVLLHFLHRPTRVQSSPGPRSTSSASSSGTTTPRPATATPSVPPAPQSRPTQPRHAVQLTDLQNILSNIQGKTSWKQYSVWENISEHSL